MTRIELIEAICAARGEPVDIKTLPLTVLRAKAFNLGFRGLKGTTSGDLVRLIENEESVVVEPRELAPGIVFDESNLTLMVNNCRVNVVGNCLTSWFCVRDLMKAIKLKKIPSDVCCENLGEIVCAVSSTNGRIIGNLSDKEKLEMFVNKEGLFRILLERETSSQFKHWMVERLCRQSFPCEHSQLEKIVDNLTRTNARLCRELDETIALRADIESLKHENAVLADQLATAIENIKIVKKISREDRNENHAMREQISFIEQQRNLFMTPSMNSLQVAHLLEAKAIAEKERDEAMTKAIARFEPILRRVAAMLVDKTKSEIEQDLLSDVLFAVDGTMDTRQERLRAERARKAREEDDARIKFDEEHKVEVRKREADQIRRNIDRHARLGIKLSDGRLDAMHARLRDLEDGRDDEQHDPDAAMYIAVSTRDVNPFVDRMGRPKGKLLLSAREIERAISEKQSARSTEEHGS